MPIDTSFLRNAAPPVEFPSPFEAHQKALALREMIERREYNKARLLEEQQQAQLRAREMAEYKQFQENLPSLPENATLEQTIKHLGYKYGLPLAKARQEASEAQSKAEKERLGANKERDLMLANQAESLKYLADNPELLASEYKRAAPYFRKAGWITEEQANAPIDWNIVESLIVRGGGAKRLEDVRNDIAKRKEDKGKAALERSQKQIELAGHYFGTVTDQASLDKWREIVPDEMRPFVPKEFSAANRQKIENMLLTAQQRVQEERAQAQLDKPTADMQDFKNFFWPRWMQANKLAQPTAQDELNAWDAYRASKTPRLPAVGMTPGAEQQAIRITQAGVTARAAAAADKPQNQAKLKEQRLTLKNLDDAVASYKKDLEVTGPTFQPGKGARLKASFTNLQMLTKSLFALGVITGPDMQILEGAITDPTGPKGNWLGTKRLLEQLEVMKAVIKRSKDNLEEVYGPGGTTPPGGPPQATHRFNPATGKIEPVSR